jgi:hypothetical protein
VAGALLRPSQLRHAASEAATLRDAAIELSQSKSCGAGARSPAMQNFAVLWRRLNRFRIDREAVQKLLALKEQRRIAGEWPESLPGIEQSSCSDGSWRYHREPNGSMSLSYAGPITTRSSDSAGLPLSFHYSK